MMDISLNSAGVPRKGLHGSGVSDKRVRAHGADDTGAQPVVRARHMLIGVCALVVFIAGPLGLVWKQSYINHTSIRLEAKAEALAGLDREIKSLNLKRNRLSDPARVERIARSRGLEYPTSRQLEVIDVRAPRQEKGIGGFITRVMQTISGNS